MVPAGLFAVVLLTVTLTGVQPIAAQDCEPGVYGCPTTSSTTGSVETTIELDVTEGEPGTVVRARAFGYVQGAAIALTFGGEPVGSGVAGADGCVVITFTVPDVPPGVRDVCATSAGRPSACAEFTVTGVLAAGATADDNAAARGSGGGLGSLARTGAAIGLLALLGLLLVLGGRAVRQAGRDRGPHEAAR